MSRRTALKTLGTGAAVLGLGAWSAARAGEAGTNKSASAASAGKAPFELPKLPYAYDALEPHIDARTMEIHHSKHHQAYITNANKSLAEHPQWQTRTAEDILQNLANTPESARSTLRNNVGGHVNHAFFWQGLGPRAGGPPKGDMATAIDKTFGSFDAFKTQFNDAAVKCFGSGWAWLVAKEGRLSVVSTANQDSPVSEGMTPLLGVDVWEHAYYLRYQNRRADYLSAFWNVVNWDQVAANHAAAR